MRRRIVALCLAATSLMLLALAPAATAAKKKKLPTITKVSPMRVAVGNKLTIRGKNFSARRKRNTVIFRAPNGRTAFSKPKRAGKKKLVVKIPPAVARLLNVRSGKPRPTRIKLRILAGKFGKFTPKRLSPVIISAGSRGKGGGGNGIGCPGSDYDHDLLTDAVEKAIGTDPCLPDTDLDGIDDGYEEQSAIDLEGTLAIPYTGKRPYPNALDPTDTGADYDSDSLQLREEFLLWKRFSADGVRRSGRPTALAPLLYSDGRQNSVNPRPAAPTAPLARWALDLPESDGTPDGFLDDAERDGDGDGLSNWDEAHGRMLESWWVSQHDGNNGEPTESRYPEDIFLDNEDLLLSEPPQLDALANPDIDGDNIPDGADDTDHDGYSNQFEVRRPADWQADIGLSPAGPNTNPWAYVNPFNPCKPFNSDVCHTTAPFGYYDNDGAPPIGPERDEYGADPQTPNG